MQAHPDPFQDALSRALQRAPALHVISLTDAHGDQIGVARASGEPPHPTPEEIGLIQVYGQLAHQRATVTLEEISVRQGAARWLSRSLEIAGDRYDLWAIWSEGEADARSTETSTVISTVTEAEASATLSALARDLTPLLRG